MSKRRIKGKKSRGKPMPKAILLSCLAVTISLNSFVIARAEVKFTGDFKTGYGQNMFTDDGNYSFLGWKDSLFTYAGNNGIWGPNFGNAPFTLLKEYDKATGAATGINPILVESNASTSDGRGNMAAYPVNFGKGINYSQTINEWMARSARTWRYGTTDINEYKVISMAYLGVGEENTLDDGSKEEYAKFKVCFKADAESGYNKSNDENCEADGWNNVIKVYTYGATGAGSSYAPQNRAKGFSSRDNDGETDPTKSTYKYGDAGIFYKNGYKSYRGVSWKSDNLNVTLTLRPQLYRASSGMTGSGTSYYNTVWSPNKPKNVYTGNPYDWNGSGFKSVYAGYGYIPREVITINTMQGAIDKSKKESLTSSTQSLYMNKYFHTVSNQQDNYVDSSVFNNLNVKKADNKYTDGLISNWSEKSASLRSDQTIDTNGALLTNRKERTNDVVYQEAVRLGNKKADTGIENPYDSNERYVCLKDIIDVRDVFCAFNYNFDKTSVGRNYMQTLEDAGEDTISFVFDASKIFWGSVDAYDYFGDTNLFLASDTSINKWTDVKGKDYTDNTNKNGIGAGIGKKHKPVDSTTSYNLFGGYTLGTKKGEVYDSSTIKAVGFSGNNKPDFINVNKHIGNYLYGSTSKYPSRVSGAESKTGLSALANTYGANYINSVRAATQSVEGGDPSNYSTVLKDADPKYIYGNKIEVNKTGIRYKSPSILGDLSFNFKEGDSEDFYKCDRGTYRDTVMFGQIKDTSTGMGCKIVDRALYAGKQYSGYSSESKNDTVNKNVSDNLTPDANGKQNYADSVAVEAVPNRFGIYYVIFNEEDTSNSVTMQTIATDSKNYKLTGWELKVDSDAIVPSVSGSKSLTEYTGVKTSGTGVKKHQLSYISDGYMKGSYDFITRRMSPDFDAETVPMMPRTNAGDRADGSYVVVDGNNCRNKKVDKRFSGYSSFLTDTEYFRGEVNDEKVSDRRIGVTCEARWSTEDYTTRDEDSIKSTLCKSNSQFMVGKHLNGYWRPTKSSNYASNETYTYGLDGNKYVDKVAYGKEMNPNMPESTDYESPLDLYEAARNYDYRAYNEAWRGDFIDDYWEYFGDEINHTPVSTSDKAKRTKWGSLDTDRYKIKSGEAAATMTLYTSYRPKKYKIVYNKDYARMETSSGYGAVAKKSSGQYGDTDLYANQVTFKTSSTATTETTERVVKYGTTYSENIQGFSSNDAYKFKGWYVDSNLYTYDSTGKYYKSSSTYRYPGATRSDYQYSSSKMPKLDLTLHKLLCSDETKSAINADLNDMEDVDFDGNGYVIYAFAMWEPQKVYIHFELGYGKIVDGGDTVPENGYKATTSTIQVGRGNTKYNTTKSYTSLADDELLRNTPEYVVGSGVTKYYDSYKRLVVCDYIGRVEYSNYAANINGLIGKVSAACEGYTFNGWLTANPLNNASGYTISWKEYDTGGSSVYNKYRILGNTELVNGYNSWKLNLLDSSGNLKDKVARSYTSTAVISLNSTNLYMDNRIRNSISTTTYTKVGGYHITLYPDWVPITYYVNYYGTNNWNGNTISHLSSRNSASYHKYRLPSSVYYNQLLKLDDYFKRDSSDVCTKTEMIPAVGSVSAMESTATKYGYKVKGVSGAYKYEFDQSMHTDPVTDDGLDDWQLIGYNFTGNKDLQVTDEKTVSAVTCDRGEDYELIPDTNVRGITTTANADVDLYSVWRRAVMLGYKATDDDLIANDPDITLYSSKLMYNNEQYIDMPVYYGSTTDSTPNKDGTSKVSYLQKENHRFTGWAIEDSSTASKIKSEFYSTTGRYSSSQDDYMRVYGKFGLYDLMDKYGEVISTIGSADGYSKKRGNTLELTLPAVANSGTYHNLGGSKVKFNRLPDNDYDAYKNSVGTFKHKDSIKLYNSTVAFAMYEQLPEVNVTVMAENDAKKSIVRNVKTNYSNINSPNVTDTFNGSYVYNIAGRKWITRIKGGNELLSRVDDLRADDYLGALQFNMISDEPDTYGNLNLGANVVSTYTENDHKDGLNGTVADDCNVESSYVATHLVDGSDNILKKISPSKYYGFNRNYVRQNITDKKASKFISYKNIIPVYLHYSSQPNAADRDFLGTCPRGEKGSYLIRYKIYKPSFYLTYHNSLSGKPYLENLSTEIHLNINGSDLSTIPDGSAPDPDDPDDKPVDPDDPGIGGGIKSTLIYEE